MERRSQLYAVGAERLDGCELEVIPRLHITSTGAWLDWTRVNVATLEQQLRSRQELYSSLGGGPRTELLLEVEPSVPERQVRPYLAAARSAGFRDVMRLPTTQRSSLQ